MRSIPGVQGCFSTYRKINEIYHINRIKYKNPIIISTDTEKAFGKIWHPILIKMFNELGIEGI